MIGTMNAQKEHKPKHETSMIIHDLVYFLSARKKYHHISQQENHVPRSEAIRVTAQP